MSLQQLLVDALLSYLPTLIQTPSGWRKTNCPMCTKRGETPDTRERFGIMTSPTSIGMNCFNCGFSALWVEGSEVSESFRELLETIGVDENIIHKLYFQSYIEKTNVVIPHFSPLAEIREWETVELPPDSQPISVWAKYGCTDPEFLMVAEYAMSRQIYDLSRVYWTPSTKDRINHRLILPYYHRDRIVGYTGRLACESPNTRSRYHHVIPDKYIYNLDAQRNYERKYTLIMEGAFDALLCDGIAMQRNGISKSQAQMINSIHTYKVVVPDRDKSGRPLVDAAIEYGWHVSFPPWGKKIKDLTDAAKQYGLLYSVRSLLYNITNDPDKIKVWRRLDEGKY